MNAAKVSTKGQVVIPHKLRQRYGIVEGSYVYFVDYGGKLYLIPVPEDPIEALHGMFTDGPSLTAELLAERKKEREREDRHLE